MPKSEEIRWCRDVRVDFALFTWIEIFPGNIFRQHRTRYEHGSIRRNAAAYCVAMGQYWGQKSVHIIYHSVVNNTFLISLVPRPTGKITRFGEVRTSGKCIRHVNFFTLGCVQRSGKSHSKKRINTPWLYYVSSRLLRVDPMFANFFTPDCTERANVFA